MSVSSFKHSADPLSKLSCFYYIEGNVEIHEAEVIVMTYHPSILNGHRLNAGVVNRIWDQHLLLVDQVPYDQSIRVDEHELTKFFNIKVASLSQGLIKGWDSSFINDSINEIVKIEKIIDQFEEKIERQFLEKVFLSFKEHQELITEMKQIGSFIFKDVEELKEFNISLDELTNFPLLTKEFKDQVNQRIAIFQGEVHRLVENHYPALFASRQELIKQAIDEGLKSEKKVMIYLNGSQVIFNPALSPKIDSEVDFLVKFLKNKNYVIIHTRGSPLFLAEDNSQLWKEKTKTIADYNNSIKQSPKARPSKSGKKVTFNMS